MQCKLCNTRIAAGERRCSNCGAEAGATTTNSSASSGKKARLPSPSASTAQDTELELELELELNDVTAEVPEETSTEAPQGAAAEIEPEPKIEPETQMKSKPEPKMKSAAKASEPKLEPTKKNPAKTSGAAPLFAPDAAGLRALLAEQPEALEEGLGVYRNDDGSPVGAAYSTAVGDIDLLATDAQGDLVVVLISEKGQGEELVAEVLQRIGWVRKHLGEGDKKVRGVVLCEEPPEGLSYAAAAVADTVRFKTYRVALTFDDLEI